MTQLLTLLLLLSLSLLSDDVIKGTTKVMTFSKIPEDAKLFFENKQIPILKHPQDVSKSIALIPVNYRSEPGLKTLTISYKSGEKKMELNIINGTYQSETLSVASSKVTPNAKQKERTVGEYQEAMKIYAAHTPKRYWKQPFTDPMQSPITSDFGTARMYNDTLKSYHSGTDFRAPTGTPVYATNDGVVALAKDRYYAGNSVILDHGEGIYSCYYHLSQLHVKKGDVLKQNDLLGLSGMSGRVTGPHLHYALMLNGVQVDPLHFHQQVNALFAQAVAQ